MSIAEGEVMYGERDTPSYAENNGPLLMDDHISRSISLEVGGQMRLRGWRTREFQA